MPRRIDELYYDITARTQGFTRGLGTASQGLRGFAGRLTAVSAGLAAFGAAAVAAGIKATRMAASLDSALREVATLLPGTVDNIERLRQGIIQLSTGIPETPEMLSRGLYQVLSSGITDTADAFEVLGVSARAAVAGLTDTFTSVDAITTVLNAYQLSASESVRVSDVFFQTVKEGKLEFPDLAANIGTVATSAALAGVSIEEVGAALATLTKFGVNSAEAATSLNRLLLSLTQVTDDQAAAARRMGVEFNLAALQSKGLVGFLQDLERATGGNLELLSELNPNIRSARAAFVLAGKGAGEYGRILAEMGDSAGSTETAFNAINGSLENQSKILRNQLNQAWLNLGNSILPLVLASLENVNRLLESDIETTIRLLRSLGREAAAAQLEAQEADRQLTRVIEDNNRRIERAIRDRSATLAQFGERVFQGTDPQGQPTFSAGALSSLRGVTDQLQLFPVLVGRTREEQEELLETAIEYADEIRTSVRLSEQQQAALAEIEAKNASILGLIQQANRLREEATPLSGEEARLTSEIDALRERASILSQVGEAEAKTVERIRKDIALRENRLAILEAETALAEAQSEAFASTIDEARANADHALRAAAATTGAERKRFEQQATAFQDTERALQRIEDLETARENINKGITSSIERQSAAVQDLVKALAEVRARIADPLNEEFFLNQELERAQRTLELLEDGIVRLAQLRQGAALEAPDEADFEAFNAEAELRRTKRALETVLQSADEFGIKALAISGILASWGGDVSDLSPELRKALAPFIEVEGVASETDARLREIISDVTFAARGATELAAAFGLVGDEASRVVNQISLIGEGIGRIASGDLLAGIGGVASGIGGLVDSIFGGGPTPEQIARDESLRENTRRIEELNNRLSVLGDILRGLPGGLSESITDALRGPLGQIEADGPNRFPGQVAADAIAIRDSLRDAGVSITDVEQAARALGIEADQLVRLLDGDSLGVAELQEAREQAESLFGLLDRGLADVLDTVQGRLGLLQDSFDILDIDEPTEQLRLIAEELERAGTALSQAEIDRLAAGDEAFIEELFRELQAGSGRFTELGAFGALSFDEFLDVLRQIEATQDRIADGVEGEGDFQRVSAQNRATTEQFDRSLALDATRNFMLGQIRDSLRGVSPVQLTDRMLAAAGRVELRFGNPLVVELRGDASGISPASAEVLASNISTQVGAALGVDREIGQNMLRMYLGYGQAPVREQ